MRMQRLSKGITGACGLLALLVISAGCGGSPAPQQAVSTQRPSPTIGLPTPTDTPRPTALPTGASLPAPVVHGALGPAPTNCPASPALQTMTTDNFGGGFGSPASFQGGPPVWQLGLPQDGSALHLQQSDTVSYPSTKVMWIVGPNVAQPVTLSGHEVRTGARLVFEIYPSNAMPIGPGTPSFYTFQAVLDPAAPNRGSTDNSTGHWNIWGLGLIALTAGCYELDTGGSGGGWHAIYAIGG